MNYVLKDSIYSFMIDNEYKKMIELSSTFAVETNGSAILDNLIKIQLLEYEPIFTLAHVVNVLIKSANKSYQLKLIGGGSYAQPKC